MQGLDTPRDYTAGAYPISVDLGDVNRDGLPDLVVANWSGYTLSVLLGQRSAQTGAWSGFADQTTALVGQAPHAVRLGDVNGDGWLDAVTINLWVDTVSVLLGTASGGTWTGFDRPLEYTVSQPMTDQYGSQPPTLALGDLNHDGHLDVVTIGSRTSNQAPGYLARVLLGQDDHGAWSGFEPLRTYVVGKSPADVALADLDGDGWLDLITANAGADTLGVRLADAGDGIWHGFQASREFSTGRYPNSLAVGDLDQDGRLDVVTTDTGSKDVSVLLGSASGGAWSGLVTTRTVANINLNTVALGDVNGDGWLDVVGVDDETNHAVVLPSQTQDGAWSGFGAATSYDVGTRPRSLVVGDVNGDGWNDVATANTGSTNVSVIASKTAPQCQ